MLAEKSKDKSNGQDSKSDKNMMELPISESDTDKKVSIFTSDTDGENMHGGIYKLSKINKYTWLDKHLFINKNM